MKILVMLLIAAAIAGMGAIGFAYSGFYDHRASTAHSDLVHWLLSTTSHASIERQAGDVSVPNLSDPALARAGASDFDAMCAGCHGAPGKARAAMGQGLNPQAPDLAKSAAHMNPAELFWVTKHGIRMTGMPAWGATHDDNAIWPVVAFMTTLPDLDVEDYQALLASGSGMGHHAEGGDASAHDHGATDAMPAAAGDGHGHGEQPPAATDHHDAPEAAPHDHAAPAPAPKPTPKPEEAPHDDKHKH